MPNERIEIEDGIACIYEMKLKGSCTVEDLAKDLANQAQTDTGYLPNNCIRETTNRNKNTVYLIAFDAQVWPDKIAHPPTVFSFVCDKKRGAILKASIGYIDTFNITDDILVRHTAHRNVYGDTGICMGQAFQLPPDLPLRQKINLFIGLYHQAKNNADLDGNMRENMPSSLESWKNIKKEKINLADHVHKFRTYKTMGDWLWSL